MLFALKHYGKQAGMAEHTALTYYKHQQDFLDLMPKKYLLSWGTGCGKTAAAIGWSNKLGTKTLVICPKSLVDNWRREIKKWSNNNSEFIVMSKENFKKNASKLTGINAVIIDEAHHESGYKSQIYKTTLSFTKNIDNVLLMTATPYRSTPFNIFALGTLLGKNWNWFKFNNTFFTTIKRGNRKWPILKQTIDGKPVKEFIADIVKSLGSVVSMDEIVDVPDHIWLREDFTVNAEQKRAINNLLDSTPIARAGHIYQIINGTLKSDGYTKDQYFKCEKFDRALEIISENDKIAVVCRHNLEIKRFADTITDRKVLVLNGETPGGERDKIIQEFNNSDNCVIIINAKVSEGYSLYTPIMLFYSLDWGLVEWTQMIGRPVRLDHLKSVVYINLIYPNTIDEDVYNNVVIKKQDFLAEIYKYEKI